MTVVCSPSCTSRSNRSHSVWKRGLSSRSWAAAMNRPGKVNSSVLDSPTFVACATSRSIASRVTSGTQSAVTAVSISYPHWHWSDQLQAFLRHERPAAMERLHAARLRGGSKAAYRPALRDRRDVRGPGRCARDRRRARLGAALAFALPGQASFLDDNRDGLDQPTRSGPAQQERGGPGPSCPACRF